MLKVTQKDKSTLWYLKLTNWLFDFPPLKNNVFFKASYRALIEFHKDEFSEVIKEGIRACKKLDEIDEQLDGNQLEVKNILGGILEEANLFFKKFDEDEEGENEKKLKNIIIEILKITQPVCQILDEILKEQKIEQDPPVEPERYPAEEPGC